MTSYPTDYTLPVPGTTLPHTDFPDVAFMGRMGAGKTTAAQWLVERFAYERLSFASGLRFVASAIWGDDGMSRDKLQKLGVAVRGIQEDSWVNMMFLNAEQQFHAPRVVDDLRFPNEYWRLKEEGFVIVRVVAEQAKRVSRLRANGKLQDESQLEHESETALDDQAADYTVFNQGSFDDLNRQIVEVLWKEAAAR